jgi:hypothetical protein
MKPGKSYRSQRDTETNHVTALKDADFGIHGFVPKGGRVKVLAASKSHVQVDLGEHAFKNIKRADPKPRIPVAQFRAHFK